MSARNRHELGPNTLAEVLAARAGTFRGTERLADRPLITPRNARGDALGTGKLARAEDDENVLTGYATAYDVGYDMYGGAPAGWVEYVVAGAGKKTLDDKPDVVHLENHTGRAFGRTKSGTLELIEDKNGLANRVHLAADDSRVPDLKISIDRGDIDEQSFAFRIVRQEWNDDYTERWITEYSIHRGDTSHVTFGANPHTSISARGESPFDQSRLAVDRFLLDLIAAGETDPLEAMARIAPHLASATTPANVGRSIRLARTQAGLI